MRIFVNFVFMSCLLLLCTCHSVIHCYDGQSKEISHRMTSMSRRINSMPHRMTSLSQMCTQETGNGWLRLAGSLKT